MKAAFVGILALTVLAAGQTDSLAGCLKCGCASTRRVCRMVPEVKKETVINYTVECEDICIPAPSIRCGPKCLLQTLPCCCFHQSNTWKPQCGCAITRKKYKREVVVEEKPGFKCVVETVCGKCGACCCDDAAAKP